MPFGRRRGSAARQRRGGYHGQRPRLAGAFALILAEDTGRRAGGRRFAGPRQNLYPCVPKGGHLGWSGFLAVGVGGVLGAWLRWGLGVALNPVFPTLPLGTLVANVVGGFIIGVAVEYFARHASVPAEVRLLVVTGFLGALTTFSTFSAEAVTLFAHRQYGWALTHVGAHLLGSLAATVAGIEAVRWLHAHA